MSTVTESTDKKPEVKGVKPLQSLSYSKKTSKDNEWGKQNLEYFINSANFTISTAGGRLSDMQSWYDAYNNRIDETLYNYVTNPLNSDNKLYKQFPAKLRSYNILRPTIDLLIGEYSKKPFKFDVLNLDGEGVLNSFTQAKYETFKNNLSQRFINELNKHSETGIPSEQIPDPRTVIEDLNTNYKDLKAIKGYKALRLLEFDHKLRERYKDHFKDWCIGGEVESLKFAKRSDIEYSRLSPLWVDYDKSPQVKNIEDGDHATVKFRVTVADLVDLFYDDLKETHLKKLEEDENAYRERLYISFAGPRATGEDDVHKEYLNKVDLYYTCWKSRKKIGFLKYLDPFSGEPLELDVDEEYVPNLQEGESIRWEWVNEVWEGWRINDNIYIGIQPVVAQRNEMNNFSSCKLPINGRRFSDTESANVSLMALGMPYQIMYIIMNYRIELAIAKSKGKILLLDKGVIPDSEAEGEDKFFYYAEALGYALIDRLQDGADRTWNQYQVLDMSLFEHITELIKLAQYYKDSWEELLGITRQRKGDITSSDGLGNSQEAIFRSSIISDIIFSSFDEWVESELQGLLDLSKFAWVDGKMGYYRNDDGRMEFLKIEPEDYVNANYGVFVDSTSRTADKLIQLRNQINAVAQRKDIKVSTIADMIWTDSYAELKAKLLQAEAIEAEIIRNQQTNEEEAKKEIEAMKKDYAEFQHMLDVRFMNKEWDRKDNSEYIKGEIQGRIAKDPSGMDIDMVAIEQESGKRLERLSKESVEREKIRSNERIAVMEDTTEQKKIAASLKNKVSGEK